MSNLDEQQALDGLRRLDSKVIGEIFDKYYPQVYRYVRYRLNDEQTAEDIASEVFVRMLDAAQGRRGPQTNIRAWLLATASHAITDFLRQSYRKPVDALPDDLLDADSAPQEIFEQRQAKRDVQRAYGRLTAEQQHVLALRFGEGFSLEETASALRKNVNAVKALQFRALAALQRNIDDANYD